MNIFYVYEHLRLDNGKVFYVGKGKLDRVNSHKNRNKHWKHIVESIGYQSRIVALALEEELAFLVEVELIDKHKSLGTILANYTNGGEGFSGSKHSEETKQKMSLAKLGKPAHNKGKFTPECVKEKMSLAKLGKFKNVFWWNNGVKNKRSVTCPGENWVRGRFK